MFVLRTREGQIFVIVPKSLASSVHICSSSKSSKTLISVLLYRYFADVIKILDRLTLQWESFLLKGFVTLQI